jgi:transcriptional regulator with XRE-family HTH domain
MSFGSRLKNLRTELGLTQKDLGDKIGVSDRVVGYYESDDRFPKDESILILISKVFNTSTDYLLGLTNTRNPIEEIETIAAHHDDENNFTEEELESIEEFKAFVKSKRKK